MPIDSPPLGIPFDVLDCAAPSAGWITARRSSSLTLVVFVTPRFIQAPSLRQDAVVGRSRTLLSIAAQAPADRAQLIPEGRPLAIALSNLSSDDGAPTASCTVRVPRDTSDLVTANVGIVAAYHDA